MALTLDEELDRAIFQFGPLARLYALVDGTLARMQGLGYPEPGAGSWGLFSLTADDTLSPAGPWLMDAAKGVPSNLAIATALAKSPAGVSWLISRLDLRALADALTQRLDVRMPDGTVSLLRWYDARLLPGIVGVMTEQQRQMFFAPAHDWLVQINGELTRVCTSRHA
jgi:hypothetical protein